MMTNETHYTPGDVGYGKLILVRHAESEWNRLGKWTGVADVHLTAKGQNDAVLIGEALRNIPIDVAYCSEQMRTFETLQVLLKAAQKESIDIKRNKNLNERDYGDYTGLNKWEVLDQVGDAAFKKIRRSWDYPIPGGETLKMVFARLVPFYRDYLVPELILGKNVLVISHGNTLRSLIKYLETINDDDIDGIEMPFDNILIYTITAEGHAASKEQRRIKITSSFA